MMGDTKKPEPKKPGEKKSGKYHYNPGNMSGKTANINKDDSEQQNNIDKIQSRKAPPRQRS